MSIGLDRVPADERDAVPVRSSGSAVAALVSTVMPAAASRVSCSRRCGLSGAGQAVPASRAAVAQGADPVGQPQQPAQVVVDHRLGDLAGLDGGDQGVAPRARPGRA